MAALVPLRHWSLRTAVLTSLCAVIACSVEPRSGGVADTLVVRAELAYADSSPSSPELIPLQLTRMLAAGHLWGYPMHLAATERFLIVYDHLAPLHIVVLNRAAGAVMGEAGRSGEGPSELQSLTHVTPFQDNGSVARLMGFDYTLRRILFLDASRTPDSVVSGVRRVEIRGYPDQAYLFPDGLVLGGMFEAAPLVRLDADEVEHPKGRHPFSAAEFPDPGARCTANRYFSAARPDGSGIALAYQFTGRVDFYAADLTLSGSFRTTPAIGPPTMVAVKGRLQWNPARLTAYRGAAASQRFLYALFCGCPVKEIPASKTAPQVHVFSWDGQLVARLVLDRNPEGIAVAPDDSRLYATLAEPVPGVGEWRLDRLLAAYAGR